MLLNNYLDVLMESALFRDIPREIVERDILPRGSLMKYHKGSYIIMRSDELVQLGIVVSGKIRQLHIFDDGKESIIKNFGPGDVLGGELLFVTGLSPHYSVAVTNGTIFVLPKELFTDHSSLPDRTAHLLVSRLLKMVSEVCYENEFRLGILSQHGIRTRLMSYLSMQAARSESSTFTIPFSRKELASYLCVNRSAMCHELSKLRQEGLIDFSKYTFTVRTP